MRTSAHISMDSKGHLIHIIITQWLSWDDARGVFPQDYVFLTICYFSLLIIINVISITKLNLNFSMLYPIINKYHI